VTCHDARELFSARVDEALTAEERASLDAHLAGCGDCRRELDRFRRTVALLHGVAPVRAPAGFVDRVLEAARPGPWRTRLLRRLFWPLPVKLPLHAAAVALIAVTAVYLYEHAPEVREAARPPAPPSPTVEAPRQEPPRKEAPRAAPPPVLAPGGRQGVAPSTPAPPPPAPEVQLKKERAFDTGDVAPPEREVKPSGPAESPPLPEARSDTSAERAKSLARPAAPPRVADQAAPVGRVSGRLAVGDRDTADRALGELLARMGGVEVGRRQEAGGVVVEILLPGVAYAEFAEGLARIGRWQPDAVPGELPAQVRLALRLTD
jgi:hypothetical protein